MSEDLHPRCERCRYWSRSAGREHGYCDHIPEDQKILYTLPTDFCRSFTPEEIDGES